LDLITYSSDIDHSFHLMPIACSVHGDHVSERSVGTSAAPRYLSSDNDPLFKFRRRKANLRILDVAEVKTVPYVPLSHPFVERLIGTIRREFLDYVPFWGAGDPCAHA
jgi:hypothetical protein